MGWIEFPACSGGTSLKSPFFPSSPGMCGLAGGVGFAQCCVMCCLWGVASALGLEGLNPVYTLVIKHRRA